MAKEKTEEVKETVTKDATAKPEHASKTTESASGESAMGQEGSTKKKEQKPIDSGKMRIKVYSPYQVYFDDQATSISAKNDTGPFDILPRHHKFLTLLNPCELVIAADKGEEKIKISRGIMYVKEDRVTVFLDV